MLLLKGYEMKANVSCVLIVSNHLLLQLGSGGK